MSNYQEFLKQFLAEKGYVKGQQRYPGEYRDLQREAGDAWALLNGKAPKVRQDKSEWGCELNATSGKCGQHPGPDDEHCTRSPITKICVRKASLAKASLPKKQQTEKQKAALAALHEKNRQRRAERAAAIAAAEAAAEEEALAAARAAIKRKSPPARRGSL